MPKNAENEQEAVSGVLSGVLVTTVLLLIALALSPLVGGWLKEQGKQIQRVQHHRTQWEKRCYMNSGRIITNTKGMPNYLCFGPDGRLLSTM